MIHCPEAGCKESFRIGRGPETRAKVCKDDKELRDALQHHLWGKHGYHAQAAHNKVRQICGAGRGAHADA